MTRKARVAPESSQSEETKSAKSSNNNSLLAFENPDLSSAITGNVIETNDNRNENLRLSNPNTNSKSKKASGKPHKRIARSVSEVVEEKEKQERNVFRRFESEDSGGGDAEKSDAGTADAASTAADASTAGDASTAADASTAGDASTEEISTETQEKVETKSEPPVKTDEPAVSSPGDGDTDDHHIGTHDGKCECCEGEGIKCGHRLNRCGSHDCDYNILYLCDKHFKKAYEYERCKHVCITGLDKTLDYCSIRFDETFFYYKKEKFMQTIEETKATFKNGLQSINDTIRVKLGKFAKYLEVTQEQRDAIIKQQIAAEEAAKEAAKARQKAIELEMERLKEMEKKEKEKAEAEAKTAAAMDVIPTESDVRLSHEIPEGLAAAPENLDEDEEEDLENLED